MWTRRRGLGYPVDARPAGRRTTARHGGALPPLLLDDEEAVAVASVRALSRQLDRGIEEASFVRREAQQVLPVRLRRKVSAFQLSALANAVARPRPEIWMCRR